MEAKGKKLLKFVGIISIVFGVLAFLCSLLALLGDGLLLKGADSAANGGLLKELGLIALVYLMFSSISAVVYLLAGICAVRNCGNITASTICMHYGKALLVVAVIGDVLGLLSKTYDPGKPVMMIASLVVSLIVPILYLIGASANRHAEKKMLAEKK